VREYEVIIADATGTDGAAAGALAEQHASLRVVHLPGKQGIGAALRAGLATARMPLVCYTLGDERYGAADLDKFLKWIDHADLVAGYRVAPEGRVRRGWGERWLAWLVRGLFAVRLRDPQCWYLLARREVFSRIPIQSDGQFAHAEVLAKANFLGKMMTEVGVTYRPRPGEDQDNTLGAAWPELVRVFRKPDFGPAKLVENRPTALAPLESNQLGSASDSKGTEQNVESSDTPPSEK
jgi:dolichol-phosphate mannosyltransferase